MLATATETWKSLKVKFSVKCSCFISVFYVTVGNADIGSPKYFVIPNKHLCHMLAKFKHNRMIRTM